MRGVAPRKLYTMEAGLSNATYSVLKLSKFLAMIYYSHCQLTTIFFHEAPQGFNLAKKSYFEILRTTQFPGCEF
jgi:hypothetical protein